jgi:hypothetical protein
LLPYNASFFWQIDIPYGFFQRAGKERAKLKNKGGRTMKAMYRIALMAAALVFLLPLSARSEIRAGSFEVGPFVGYNFFQSSQNLKNGLLFGGRVGYNFTRHFGIEGAGEYI